MMKITMLALVLVAIALSGVMSVAMSVASAETVPSPLQQVQDGVPIGEVMCSEDRVLMVSPSGSPACVHTTSTGNLLQRGFVLVITQDTSVDNPDKFPARYTYEFNPSHGSTGHAIGRGMPPVSFTIDIPSSFVIGQNVTIPYSYSWQYSNGTSIYEQRGMSEPDAYVGVMSLTIPDEFTLSNDNAVVHFGFGDLRTPHYITTFLIHDMSSELTFNGTINLRLDSTMYHDRDVFSVSSHGYDFQVQRTDTGARLVDPALLTDQYDLEHLNAFIRGDYNNGPDGRYAKLYGAVNGTFVHTPLTTQSSSTQRAEEPQEDLYIPKAGWPEFAEFLRSEIEFRNITNAGDWMIENDLSKEFVTGFLKAYPEFAITDTGFSRSESVRQAPPQIFIYGHYNDHRNNPLQNVRVCALDNNMSSNMTEILYNGMTKVSR